MKRFCAIRFVVECGRSVLAWAGGLVLVAMIVLSPATSHAQTFTQVPADAGDLATAHLAKAAQLSMGGAGIASGGDKFPAGNSHLNPWPPHTELVRTPDVWTAAGLATQTSHTPASPPPASPYRFPSYDPVFGVKVLDPVDPQQHPFSLNITGNIESRYFGFARSQETAVDSTGAVQSVRNLSLFEFPRWWLQVDGFAGRPEITYSLMLFGTSASTTGLESTPLGLVGYRFGEALHLNIGVSKVPGTREWTESYKWHFGVDRSMATTFFRPSVSPGMYAYGKLGENVRYSAAIVNGINGGDFNASRPGTNMAYVFNPTWEPLGPYGPGFSDVEYHDETVVRIGGSVVASPNATINDQIEGNPENTLVRLSDGTLLAELGALGPGVTVTSADDYLFTVDLGVKSRGTSLSFEYMFRYLDDLKTTGGPPNRSSLFDHGGYLYLGHFLWLNTFELYGRTSYVTGEFGSGHEFGGGVNWFINGSRKQRVVFEVLRYDDNPADNDLTPYRAFFSGTAIQLEYFVAF